MLTANPSEEWGQREEELDGLVEMMEIKDKIDYCLGKLERIVNADDDEGEGEGEKGGAGEGQ